jgi:thioester reductase-like protein
MDRKVYLKPNAIAEPLIDQWYAWSYLISPATSAMYVANSHIKIMESFIEAPQVHQTALKNPAMMGGPFISHDASRIDAIRTILEKTKAEQANLLTLAEAIKNLDQLLRKHATGYSLEPLYQQIPEPLKGYVELVYDASNQASVRYIERLFYQSAYYNSTRQTVALSLTDEDSRSFVLSTPRLQESHSLHLNFPFNHSNWDQLFRMRDVPQSYREIKAAFEIKDREEELFASFFTEESEHKSNKYTGDSIRVRYFGHACVLIETQGISILCDPLISYQHHAGIPRYTYSDLPEVIDYVLITHNHQDHVMFETLLQLRHKVRQIVVPLGNKGVLVDPSLKLILEAIGFSNVKEIDELETIEIDSGSIVALPVFGEHGDLNISTKTAYWINLKGRAILCAADSNNIEPALYKHLHDLLGDVDVLFIGMECDGAPYTWAYGSLLTQSTPRKMAQTRRLDGSNAERAFELVNQFNPQQVYVYAMGQEPWLTYITSIQYTSDSRPIIESNKLVESCIKHGIVSERLFGCKEFVLESKVEERKWKSGSGRAEVAKSEVAKSEVGNNGSQLGIPNSEFLIPNSKRPIDEFLKELSQKDIKLWIEENPGTTTSEPRLKCNAPKGTLTPALQAELKERKAEIMQFLHNRATNGTKLDLEAEAILDRNIQPESPLQSTCQLNNIFLTGATGFLGAFLLYELLQDTQAKIYCLVRAETIESAQHRLQSCLQSYLLWEESFSSRMIPVVGDLSQPLLGLSQPQFQALADEIDIIYHNGAWVHHTLPYSSLKAANVLGTQEVLRLACLSKVKPVHFISTKSVFAETDSQKVQIIREQERLDPNRLPIGGYAQSKWVAEKLVTIARDRSLPVSIYRIGAIGGHSQTGVFNTNDFLYKFIQGCIQLGSAPVGTTMLDIMPVDYVARAIVSLSKQPASWGEFHLVHPQPTSVDVLFDQLCSRGYSIQRLPYDQWRAMLLKIAESSPDHPLYAIFSLFATNRSGGSHSATLQFDCQNTLTRLAETSIVCPPIDATLLNTYLSYLMQNGFLDAPTQCSELKQVGVEVIK